MGTVHRIAGLKISRVAPMPQAEDQEFWTPRESLPDLEPPEDRLKRFKNQIFSSDSIALTHGSAVDDVFDPARRDEHGSSVARATVYVSNMVLMLMAPPIGLGMLLLNILGGENLRTTLHLVALAGMATALASSTDATWLNVILA